MLKRLILILILCFFSIFYIYGEDIDSAINNDVAELFRCKIETVEYKIDGFTKEAPLAAKVLIDKTRVFNSKEEFDIYIAELNKEFKNIRTIEKHEIRFEFLEPQNGITPVKMNIHVDDTWNIIALPYPSFDSNEGFEFKIKLKDFNFLGRLEPLSIDLVYSKDNNDKSSFSLGSKFALPFYVNPVKLIWFTEAGLSINQDKEFGLNIETGLNVEYKLWFKWLTLNAGLTQGLDVLTSPSEKNYYLINGFYTSLVFELYKNAVLGTIKWTPYFEVEGDWKFQKITDEKHKGANITWSHSLDMGKVNWVNNFRQGFTAALYNTYEYNTYRRGNIDISFDIGAEGFYSFVDRVGLYGRFNLFYNLFNKLSDKKTGKILRGILNKRISTDTAISFNFDVPVKIGVFKWEEITGIAWTRFFGFELHVSPFLDMALVHDTESKTYYNPKYGWYSGGLEIIMYPIKMRSIYARISYGHDLREIKNKTGYAKRDGKPVSEIFIGIGLHY